MMSAKLFTQFNFNVVERFKTINGKIRGNNKESADGIFGLKRSNCFRNKRIEPRSSLIKTTLEAKYPVVFYKTELIHDSAYGLFSLFVIGITRIKITPRNRMKCKQQFVTWLRTKTSVLNALDKRTDIELFSIVGRRYF